MRGSMYNMGLMGYQRSDGRTMRSDRADDMPIRESRGPGRRSNAEKAAEEKRQ